MGVYIVPAYIKPHTKITTWILPMCYLEDDNNEYINDNGIVKITIKDSIDYYNKATKMTLKIDAIGEPMQYKVHIAEQRPSVRPLELFLSTACKNLKLAEVEGSFNLLNTSGVKLIQDIFSKLTEDVRSTIAVPLQWLVYKPSEKLLTRLCWVNEIHGKIIVKPYTQRNLLLEVHGDVKFDKVNSFDLHVVKRNIVSKNILNDEWRQMVMETTVAETLETITTSAEHVEERKEQVTESGEIGKVE